MQDAKSILVVTLVGLAAVLSASGAAQATPISSSWKVAVDGPDIRARGIIQFVTATGSTTSTSDVVALALRGTTFGHSWSCAAEGLNGGDCLLAVDLQVLPNGELDSLFFRTVELSVGTGGVAVDLSFVANGPSTSTCNQILSTAGCDGEFRKVAGSGSVSTAVRAAEPGTLTLFGLGLLGLGITGRSERSRLRRPTRATGWYLSRRGS